MAMSKLRFGYDISWVNPGFGVGIFFPPGWYGIHFTILMFYFEFYLDFKKYD